MLAGGYTIYQLARGWREFWTGGLTTRNSQLAGSIAFFLLVPVGVLLHEVGHMVSAWSTGSRVLGLNYFVYWGYVEYIPASGSALLEWYVSLAGNFVNYVLGIGALVAAAVLRIRPVVRTVIYQFGLLELLQTLIFYPLLSVDPGFDGDWDSIYSFRAPVASGITLAVHIVSLGVLVYFLRKKQVED